MVRILLVDDDASMRARLKSMIDWEANGYLVCGDARNGKECIERIDKLRPDIIITDISMPVVNGIELIDYVTSLDEQIGVIALSAFDDFDYVRSSLKLGAQDYLLKHELTPERLLTALNAAAKTLDAPSRDGKGTDSAEAGLQTLLLMLLSGCMESGGAVEERLAALGLEHLNQPLIAALAEPDAPSPTEDGHAQRALLHILRESAGGDEGAVVSMIGKDRFLVLIPVSGYPHGRMWERARKILLRMRENTHRYLNVSLSVAMSDLCPEIMRLSAAYEQAWELMQRERFSGGEDFLVGPMDNMAFQGPVSVAPETEREIRASLKNGDAARVVTEVFSRYAEMGLARESLEMVHIELLNIALRELREAGLIEEQFFQDRNITVKSIRDFTSIQEMSEWFSRLFAGLAEELAEIKPFPQSGEHTRFAILYMRENYYRGISLRDIARAVNINSSYLSRLFKNETGVNVMAYLNKLRIDRAAELLREDKLTLKEIAATVGFPNYNHFFTLFKAAKGVTPNEFRNTL